MKEFVLIIFSAAIYISVSAVCLINKKIKISNIYIVQMIHGENYCDTGLRAPDNSTDPNDCCRAPLFLPVDIVKECRDTYLEMQKKKNDLPGPPRGCVSGNGLFFKYLNSLTVILVYWRLHFGEDGIQSKGGR